MRRERSLDGLPRDGLALQGFGGVFWEEGGVSKEDFAPSHQHEWRNTPPLLGVHPRMNMPEVTTSVCNTSPPAVPTLDRSPESSAWCSHTWIQVQAANNLLGLLTAIKALF